MRQPRDLAARPDVAPTEGLPVPVRHHARRVLTFAASPHSQFSAPAADLVDFGGPQPVGQTPTVVRAALSVDHIGEVLKPLRRHGYVSQLILAVSPLDNDIRRHSRTSAWVYYFVGSLSNVCQAASGSSIRLRGTSTVRHLPASARLHPVPT